MSTFTITISANGSVNGQRIQYSKTFTVDDVYDARVARVGAGELNGIGHTSTEFVNAVQECPSMIYVRNSSTNAPACAILNDNITADAKYIGLSAGQFILLHESVNGENIIASDSSPTTTLEPVTGIQIGPFVNFHGLVEGSIMTLNIAST